MNMKSFDSFVYLRLSWRRVCIAFVCNSIGEGWDGICFLYSYANVIFYDPGRADEMRSSSSSPSSSSSLLRDLSRSRSLFFFSFLPG